MYPANKLTSACEIMLKTYCCNSLCKYLRNCRFCEMYKETVHFIDKKSLDHIMK